MTDARESHCQQVANKRKPSQDTKKQSNSFPEIFVTEKQFLKGFHDLLDKSENFSNKIFQNKNFNFQISSFYG